MGTCRHRFDPLLIFFVQVETLLKSRFQDPWFEGSKFAADGSLFFTLCTW